MARAKVVTHHDKCFEDLVIGVTLIVQKHGRCIRMDSKTNITSEDLCAGGS